MSNEQGAVSRPLLRRLAREAVVFALLGFFVVLAADFVLDSRHASPTAEVQEDATANQKGPNPFLSFGGQRYVRPDFFPAPKPNASIDYALLVDPRFRSLSPAGKRVVLESMTGDKDFASLSDAQTMEFASRLQAKGALIVAPNGEIGSIPAERLSDALAAGYKKADIFDVVAAENNSTPAKLASRKKIWRDSTLAWIRAFIFHFLIGALVGLPSGIVIWGFYRMIRFAIVG